jgi:hypothetical protein
MPFIGNKPSAVPLTSADIADGIITSAKIVDGTIVNADINASAAIVSTKLSGVVSGLTEADIFRLTTIFTGNATPIASNWERADDASSGLLGTGMSQSSGVFTFPSTGIYYVKFAHIFYESTGDDRAIINSINVSSDGGSTYDEVCEGLGMLKNVSPGSNSAGNSHASAIIDVTSTANIKVRFSVTKVNSAVTTNGDTNSNKTFVTFIRLGDT